MSQKVNAYAAMEKLEVPVKLLTLAIATLTIFATGSFPVITFWVG